MLPLSVVPTGVNIAAVEATPAAPAAPDAKAPGENDDDNDDDNGEDDAEIEVEEGVVVALAVLEVAVNADMEGELGYKVGL